jgi:energy-coupling factor transporter ATP-binding protein EcfA2
MGVHLESVKIQGFRGLSVYDIDNLGKWVSITGPNSTSKSSIIKALSFLGSFEMHDLQDIPRSYFRPKEFDPREFPFVITYIFRLNNRFDELMADNRLLETLADLYEYLLEGPGGDSYKSHIDNALTSLRTKGPLGKILDDALYKTIRTKIEGNSGYDPYKPFFHSDGHFKMPDEILDEAKFLCIKLEFRLSDGPSYYFSLLDEERNPLINDEVFYWWLENQDVISDGDKMSLSYVIGAVFIKSVIPLAIETEEKGRLSILAPDGSNIRDYIEYCLKYKPKILDNFSAYFNRIFGHYIEFKKAPISSPYGEDKMLIKIGDTEWFPFAKLADGMLHALRILLQLASCIEGDILVIDEPELHLHPGAAKCLKEIFAEKKAEIQIICATHSPNFIDPFVTDTLILNQNIDGDIKPKILDAKQVDFALSELGSSGLDLLLFDIIIWIEGPSDKVYLDRWLHILQNKIKYSSLSHIGLLPYWGKDNLRHLNMVTIRSINRKSIFVIDSDKASEDADLDETTKSFISKCEKNGLFCWVTKRRSIENYIPVEILEDKLHLEKGKLKISEYDDVIGKLKTVGRNYGGKKVELAKTVASSITVDHLTQDKNFCDELGDLIKRINALYETSYMRPSEHDVEV